MAASRKIPIRQVRSKRFAPRAPSPSCGRGHIVVPISLLWRKEIGRDPLGTWRLGLALPFTPPIRADAVRGTSGRAAEDAWCGGSPRLHLVPADPCPI